MPATPPIESLGAPIRRFGLVAVGAVAVAVVSARAARIGHRSGSMLRPAAYVLAVLPFDNDLGYCGQCQDLADGLAEEPLPRSEPSICLAVGLIGRTSVVPATYKCTTRVVVRFLLVLAVDFLIGPAAIRTECSRRARLISRLIRAADQVQLWSALVRTGAHETRSISRRT